MVSGTGILKVSKQNNDIDQNAPKKILYQWGIKPVGKYHEELADPVPSKTSKAGENHF